MSQCSIIQSLAIVAGERSLFEISELIRSDRNKKAIEEIRFLYANNKQEEAEGKKRALSGFTPCGTFKHRRSSTSIIEYSKIVHLDFDDLTSNQLKSAQKSVCGIPFTRMCFISPSGKGLKIFVEVNCKLEDHENAFYQVNNYYETIVSVKSDTTCKDISRLCFMTWDPDLYINLDSDVFIIDENISSFTAAPLLQEEDKNSTHIEKKLEEAIRLTKSRKNYEKGNRNNFIYFFACNCNRLGVPESNVLYYCLTSFDLATSRIKNTVKSAYRNHLREFGKASNSLGKGHSDNPQIPQPAVEDVLLSTPFIREEVYIGLPGLLKEATGIFNNKRERDVAMTGMLVALSASMSMVSGTYMSRRVYPPLYAIITAPPANGKGVVELIKRCLQKHQSNVVNRSREALERYEAELDAFNKCGSNKKRSAPAGKPTKPKNKVFFIPANCSTTRMVGLLYENGGEGLIIETEVDIMANAKKQDWSDYSSILRCAFHHETISITRKTDDLYLEIREPKMASLLAGTPSQIPKLISSAEDGLLSRIINYIFRKEIAWHDPSPKEGQLNYGDHFDRIGEEVVKLVEFLGARSTEIFLTDTQWDIFNREFSNILTDVLLYADGAAESIVYRLGLVAFRICMILTAIRKFERNDASNTEYCIDEDLDRALSLCRTYLQHNILMFNNLPKDEVVMDFAKSENKRKLFMQLPDEFSRQDAVRMGAKFHLKTRSVDEFLKKAVGEYLEKISNGYYRKLPNPMRK
jgi:hypothetical protein